MAVSEVTGLQENRPWDIFLGNNASEGRGEEALGPGLCPPSVGGRTKMTSTQMTSTLLKVKGEPQLP